MGNSQKNAFHIAHKQNAVYCAKTKVGNCCIQRTESLYAAINVRTKEMKSYQNVDTSWSTR